MHTTSHKPLYGIWVKKLPEEILPPDNSYCLNFQTTPGTYDAQKIRPDNLFVTNKEIQNELKKIYLQHTKSNKPLFENGDIIVEVLTPQKIIITDTFAPLPHIETNKGSYKEILRKTGLGTLAELAMEKMLLTEHPDYLIFA